MSEVLTNNETSESNTATTTSTQRTLRSRRTSRSDLGCQGPLSGEQGQGLPSSLTGAVGDTTATGSRNQARGRGRGRGRAARGGRTTTSSRRSTRQDDEAPSRQTARHTGEATNGISAGSHPTVPQPIFTFVTPPKVIDISHNGMTRWLDLRLEYEEAIKARCKNSGEELDAVMTSVRNSFDESLLDTLCEVVWVKDRSELTEVFLWDWVMKTVESFKNHTLPNIEDLFQRELSMGESQGDVEAQVTNYFHSCNTRIRTNGLVGLFKTEDGMKKKCKVFVNSLPARLKKTAKNEIDFRAQGAKSSVLELFKLIMELDQEKIDRAVRGAGGKGKKHDGEGSNDAKNSSFTPRKRQYHGKSSKNNHGGHQDRRQVEDKGDARQNSRSSNQRGCFSCGGAHLVRDCPEWNAQPTLPTATMVSIDNRSTDKGGTARLRQIRQCLPEDKLTIRVSDLLQLPYCADSGAFKSGISRSNVEILNGAEIEIVNLRQPILCELVGGRTLKVKEVVYLKLSLRTAAGQVNIHSPVACLVVDGQDEFLLGRDVLSMLGIDVDRQLELLAWSDGTDDDDIDDDPAVSRKNDGEIKQAVEAMIERALEEGFPSDLSTDFAL